MLFERGGCLVEGGGIVAGECDVERCAVAACPDLDPDARENGERLADVVFDFGLCPISVAYFLEIDDERCGRGVGGRRRSDQVAGRGAADRGEYVCDVRQAGHEICRPSCHCIRLFNCAAGLQRDCDLGLRIVRRRQESGTEEWDHRQRQAEEQADAEDRQLAVAQAGFGDRHVGAHDPAILGFDGMRLHHIGSHHRREQARNNQRSENGHGGCNAELAENQARNSAHEGRREEDRDECQGRGNDGKADFIGSFERGLLRRFPHLQVARDILDLDDGIIDEDADHERECKQRHRIEAEIRQVHHKEGRNDRQRQRHGGEEAGPPVAQKEAYDHDGEDRALVEHVHGAVVVLDDRPDGAVGFDDLDIGIFGGKVPHGRFGSGGNARVRKTVQPLDLNSDHGLSIEIGN